MSGHAVDLSKIYPETMERYLFSLFLLLFLLIFNSGMVPAFMAADEVFLILSLFVISVHFFQGIRRGRLKVIYLLFFAYIFYQFVNIIASPFSLNPLFVIVQSVINIKVFLFLVVVLLVWSGSKSQIRLVKQSYYLMIFLFLVGMVFNLIFQENWHQLTGASEQIDYRYGFLRPVGWLGHPAQNAYFFTITFTTLFLTFSGKPIVNAGILIKKFFVFSVIDFLMAFPLTVRKGLLMSIPFGVYALSRLRGKNKFGFVLISLAFLFLSLYYIRDMMIFKDTVSNFVDFTHSDHSYIRGLMIFYGFSLFLEFFPFGTGNATFGTVLSQYNTLEVYKYVGLDLDRIFYSQGRLTGVYDSGFFSMLAENGFLGMVIMFVFIFYFFKFNKVRLGAGNYLIFKIITWFILLLSIIEPVWQNGMLAVTYSMNILYLHCRDRSVRVPVN